MDWILEHFLWIVLGYMPQIHIGSSDGLLPDGLRLCLLSSRLPYGITKPQWVNMDGLVQDCGAYITNALSLDTIMH